MNPPGTVSDPRQQVKFCREVFSLFLNLQHFVRDSEVELHVAKSKKMGPHARTLVFFSFSQGLYLQLEIYRSPWMTFIIALQCSTNGKMESPCNETAPRCRCPSTFEPYPSLASRPIAPRIGPTALLYPQVASPVRQLVIKIAVDELTRLS